MWCFCKFLIHVPLKHVFFLFLFKLTYKWHMHGEEVKERPTSDTERQDRRCSWAGRGRGKEETRRGELVHTTRLSLSGGNGVAGPRNFNGCLLPRLLQDLREESSSLDGGEVGLIIWPPLKKFRNAIDLAFPRTYIQFPCANLTIHVTILVGSYAPLRANDYLYDTKCSLSWRDPHRIP